MYVTKKEELRRHDFKESATETMIYDNVLLAIIKSDEAKSSVSQFHSHIHSVFKEKNLNLVNNNHKWHKIVSMKIFNLLMIGLVTIEVTLSSFLLKVLIYLFIN